MLISRFLIATCLIYFAQLTHGIAADLADSIAIASPSNVHVVVFTNTASAKRDPANSLSPPKKTNSMARDGRSTGSGVIISEDGYIVSVAYLFNGAEEIEVWTADRQKFKAKLVGRDMQKNIALLKIDASRLKAAKIGDLSKTRLGEWIFSMGILPEEMGMAPIATNGIISALNRKIDGNYMPMIQTTAALTPGMGGGGLFNTAGELLGINSQVYQNKNQTANISFCIPIDDAMEIIPALKQFGHVRRSGIGIRIGEVNNDLAKVLGMPTAAGALVQAVEPDSPAEKANMQAGDIILRIANHEIRKSWDAPRALSQIEPGSVISIQVWRKGDMKNLTVTTREVPSYP